MGPVCVGVAELEVEVEVEVLLTELVELPKVVESLAVLLEPEEDLVALELRLLDDLEGPAVLLELEVLDKVETVAWEMLRLAASSARSLDGARD